MAYALSDTPAIWPFGLNGGMTDSAARPAPPRRTRGFVLLSLAVLGVAGAAFAVRRPLTMAAPACLAGRWHGCYDTENGVVLMMLAGLPLVGLASRRWWAPAVVPSDRPRPVPAAAG